jgi:hypothetical protein
MIQEWGNMGSPELGYSDEIMRPDYRNSLFLELVVTRGKVHRMMGKLTFIPRTPRLRRTDWRMHSTDVKNTKSTRGSKVIELLGSGPVDKRIRGYGDWLRIALRGNVSRVLSVLGRVGVWPKLRFVRRECSGIGMPILRMIGVMFAVVELQKIGRIHEGGVEGGGVDERRAERAVFDVVDGEGGKGASQRVLLYVSR